MTNEEATANYKYDRAIILIRRIKTEETHEREVDRHKAFDLAISALEKQIPKKPLNPCGRYFGKAKGGNCPCCGAHTNSITNNYCRKCGQKLLWE